MLATQTPLSHFAGPLNVSVARLLTCRPALCPQVPALAFGLFRAWGAFPSHPSVTPQEVLKGQCRQSLPSEAHLLLSVPVSFSRILPQTSPPFPLPAVASLLLPPRRPGRPIFLLRGVDGAASRLEPVFPPGGGGHRGKDCFPTRAPSRCLCPSTPVKSPKAQNLCH